MAPGQSDQSSAEGPRPARRWRVCIDPSVGGLCRSQSCVLTVRHAVSRPGVLLNIKINGLGFILSLSLQTKVYL